MHKVHQYSLYVTFTVIFLSIAGFYTEYDAIVLSISAVLLGLSCSHLFPYLLSLPTYFKIRISNEEMANALIAFSTGEAIIATILGYVMTVFGPMSLYFGFAIIFAVINLFYKWEIREMEKI